MCYVFIFYSYALAASELINIEKYNSTPSHPEIEGKDEYSDWAYSATFAKRFKLDESKVEQLSKGLLAIEFNAIASGLKIYTHECSINLYLSDKIAIRYPESATAGYLNDIQKFNNIFEFSNRNERDKIAYNKIHYYDAAYAPIRIRNSFKSIELAKANIQIMSYRKNAFPGIHFISLYKQNCADILPPRFGMRLLLRKPGKIDYIPAMSLDDFVEVEMPEKLHKRVCPVIEKIAHDSFNKRMKNLPSHFKFIKSSSEPINSYSLGCILPIN